MKFTLNLFIIIYYDLIFKNQINFEKKRSFNTRNSTFLFLFQEVRLQDLSLKNAQICGQELLQTPAALRDYSENHLLFVINLNKF